MPKALATYTSGGNCTTIAFRVLHTSYDPFLYRNTSPYISLGGVFILEFLSVPPAPLKAKDWLIREITEVTEKCVTRPYPGLTDSAIVQSIRISYPLPRNILFSEDHLQLAYFDEKENVWKLDGSVADAKFNSSEHSVSFSVLAHKLNPIALVQLRSFDLPYRSWSCQANATRSIIINVQTSRLTFQFEITENLVSLIQPSVSAFSDLVNKPLPPGVLLNNLARRGANLLPDNADAEPLQLQVKNADLETKLYNELSQLLPNYEISSNILNSIGGETHAYVHIRESPHFFPSSNEPIRTAFISAEKCLLLKSKFKVGIRPIPLELEIEGQEVEKAVKDDLLEGDKIETKAAEPEVLSESVVKEQVLAVDDSKRKQILEDYLITPENAFQLNAHDHFEVCKLFYLTFMQAAHSTIMRSLPLSPSLTTNVDFARLKLQDAAYQMLSLMRLISFQPK